MNLEIVAGNFFIVCLIAIMVFLTVLACVRICLGIKMMFDDYRYISKKRDSEEKICLKK